MARTISHQDWDTSKSILMFPEPYVGLAHTFYPTDANVKTLANGKKVIPAGTIYPANDSTAIGVVYYDVDVTNGEADGSLLVEAHIKTIKIPVVPTAQAKAALPNVLFYPLTAVTVSGDAVPLEVPAGTGADTEFDVVYNLVGDRFRDEAETLTNWTITGESTVKIDVESIKLGANLKYVTMHLKASASTVAGSITVLPGAVCTGTGNVPASATTIVTVA